jgi:hypothetical protein
MNGPPFDRCAFAIQRYKSIAMWRNLWTILLFIFGSTVILFLCGSILLFVQESWLPAAISILGTIVNGVGVKWVVTRRNEAVQEELDAYHDVGTECPGAGKERTVTGAAKGDEGRLQELEGFRKKLMLFGLFR